MTSNRRQPQTIKSGISQKPIIGSYSNFKLKLRWPNHSLQILKMKPTSNGRWPEKILEVKYLITCKLKLRLPNYVLNSLKWRRLQMENDLKISTVEYPSNNLLDHTQFLNLSIKAIFYKSFQWRQPRLKTKILKAEYLSNHLLDTTQILNIRLED